MKKTIIITIMALMLVGVVTAGLFSTFSKTTIIIPTKETQQRYSGLITFDVDGSEETCYLDEPDMNIDDDVLDCFKQYEGSTITNIKDWTDRDFKEVEIDGVKHRSFDDAKLTALSAEPEPMGEGELII